MSRDVCERCGEELFMVASGDVTCMNRCRFVAPDREMYDRLKHTRVRLIPYQLREFTRAMKRYRDAVEEEVNDAAQD